MPNFFYLDHFNQKHGPYNEQRLKSLAAQGIINPNTPMETDTGHKGTAGQIPGLQFNTAAPSPFVQPAPVAPSVANTTAGATSRSTFVILAILAGGLGIHNFYAKRKCFVQVEEGKLNPPLGLLNIALTIIAIVFFAQSMRNDAMAEVFHQRSLQDIRMGDSLGQRAANEKRADNFATWSERFYLIALVIFIGHFIWIIRDVMLCNIDGDGMPMQP